MSDTRTSSSHWGAFLVDAAAEGIAVRAHPDDPDPSPLLGGIAGSVHHRSRVARPAVRRGWLERGPGPDGQRGDPDDPFVEVPWDEVLDRLAAELDRVRNEHGNEAIFGGSYGWASAGRFQHAQSQLHRFLNTVGGYTRSVNSYSLGASHVVLRHLVGHVGEEQVLRNGTSWPVLAEHTDLVVAFGGMRTSNTWVTPGGRLRHTQRAGLEALAARGTEVVSFSPLRDDVTAGLDATWLALVPGTDVAVMLALAHVLLAEDLVDHEFVDRYTVGVERVVASVRGALDGVEKTPEWAESVSGVPAATVRELARRMAAGRTFVTVSWSLQRTFRGEQVLWAGMALAALLGQIGLPGGGFGHGYGSMGDVGGGTLDYGLPTFRQGRNPVGTFIPCARIADLLLNPGETFDYDGDLHVYPDIRLVWWAGGNPFHHHQDLTRLRRALRRPDTVVVNEPYWTPMARHADVVLPVTTSLERDDWGVGRHDSHLVAMQRSLDPPGEARDEYELLADLSVRLGVGEAFTEGRTAHEWLVHLYDDWARRMDDRGLPVPSFADAWEAGTVPLPERRERVVLFEDFCRDPDAWPLDTPSGRIELHSEVVASFGYDDCPGYPVWIEPPPSPFPLHLIANQPATRLHSQHDMGAVSQAAKVHGREPVRIHPDDARARGIDDGDIVRIHNDRGSCLAGAVISDDVRAGVVQLSTGAWFDPPEDPSIGVTCVHGNPNVLTEDVGTSRLAQGCTGQHARVDVERWAGPLPRVRAFEPPVCAPRS